MQFESVIGLEVHAQLATNTKMFCSCQTSFGEQPNTNTCPVCLALPGALPTINQTAIKFAIQLGLATNCSIRLDSEFARKNYYYPDLPKAYQISQYDKPICENGWIDITVNSKVKRIGITRIHLEEDAGKLVHEGQDPNASYIDLNRAGTPLVEIVSEPDIRSADEAKAYMEKIHSIVTYLGVCNGDMEKGNLRCDANISLKPFEQTEFGTRTETKNLNSFRNVHAAIEAEIARQTDAIIDGETIYQQTLLWDANKKQSRVLRTKENADDYRYFPCPDLPLVLVEESAVEEYKKNLPELPDAKQERFMEAYKLSEYDAAILVVNKKTAAYFEDTVKQYGMAKKIANWIAGDFARLLNEAKIEITDSKITSAHLGELVQLIEKGTISGKIGKTIFETMFETGKMPQDLIKEQGLEQVSDTSLLQSICEKIVAANPNQVAQYKEGRTKLFGFFVGQAMKETQGKGNPKLVSDIFTNLLK